MNMFVDDKPASTRASEGRPLVRIVFVGHVDHGKSTLIGRLLHETGSLPDGKFENISAVSARRGAAFEWSFLLDALQTERDQGITLDTSQIRLRTAARDIVLIDAPGHAELVRNMVTGAAQADAALLVVDALEGVRDQTRRHIHLLHLLGISQVAVVVNKMDRVDFSRGRFAEIEAEIVGELAKLGLLARAILPIAARHGDGVAQPSPAMAWHSGPTVLQVLDQIAPATLPADLPLRIPVQAVYKFDARRIVAGRIESGRLAAGDEVVVMPRGTRARVQSIEAWPSSAGGRPQQVVARAGRSIGLTLDRPIFVDRGDLIAASVAAAIAARRLRARVFWLHEETLFVGATLGVRVGTAERRARIVAVENVVDPGELSPSAPQAIARNYIGEIEIELAEPIAADRHIENPRTGRLVLDVAGRIAGGGLVLSLGDGADRKQGAARDNGLAAQAARLSALLDALPPGERLARFCREVAGRVVFTTSFGPEDQAILHMLHDGAIDADVVTLDTGRLFAETYELWAATERRYGRRIRAIYPQHADLERLIEQYGINGFYESREARSACCHARKVEPLNRALSGASAWIVGLRADQSGARGSTALVSVDDRGLLKFSPLFDWSRETLQAYVAAHGVAVNRLHARGFASIGCAPCTRAIAPGEPERAGRWWWEQDDKKECGLHTRNGGAGATVVERSP